LQNYNKLVAQDGQDSTVVFIQCRSATTLIPITF
jgi:hypothetical protein